MLAGGLTIGNVLSRGRKASTTIGAGSIALGNNVEASGDYSQAFGSGTSATQMYAHAEGYMTSAQGLEAHAEGMSTTAGGNGSHAEGTFAKATGNNAHAEGLGTEAKHRSQHVFGEYNVPDPSTNAVGARGTYVEIVGNGGSGTSKSNARTLDWSGNETLAGSLTLGKGTADEVTITAAQLKALLALLS